MIVVIFGASGDLAKRKIFPSLLNCATRPTQIIGYGRQDLRTSFRQLLHDFHPYPSDFLDIVEYVRGDYSDLTLLHRFKNEEVLFYFSVPPSVYETLLSEISFFSRGYVALEKPFASEKHELAQIDIFGRENPGFKVLMVDHYLLKPLITVLPVVKSCRPSFTSSLKFENIKAVHVISKEQLGIEGRGYFDETGILKDIVQNHLLSFYATVFAKSGAAEDPKALGKVLEAAQKIKNVFKNDNDYSTGIFDATSEGPSFPDEQNLLQARKDIETAKLSKSEQIPGNQCEGVSQNTKTESSGNNGVTTGGKAVNISQKNEECGNSDEGIKDTDSQEYTGLEHQEPRKASENDTTGNNVKIGETSTAGGIVNQDGTTSFIKINENFVKASKEETNHRDQFTAEYNSNLASARFDAIMDLNIKKEYAVFGQYEGYETELGKSSLTETFITAVLQNSVKVPIVFTSGKGLDSKLTELRIIYKEQCYKEIIENLLPVESKSSIPVKISNIESVDLVFSIYPHNAVYLNVRMKNKTRKYEIFGKELIDNIYSSIYGDLSDHALIFESIFTSKPIPTTSSDEAKYQWSIFDFKHLKSKRGIFKYEKGIDFPLEAAELLVSLNIPGALTC